jgi:hypothetical protein
MYAQGVMVYAENGDRDAENGEDRENYDYNFYKMDVRVRSDF